MTGGKASRRFRASKAGLVSGRNLSQVSQSMVKVPHARVQLEMAITQLEKQLDFESQHGPVRILMKDGKPINIDKGEK